MSTVPEVAAARLETRKFGNDLTASAIGTAGADTLSVDVTRNGIVGRGVLL